MSKGNSRLEQLLRTVPAFQNGLYNQLGATYTSMLEHLLWGK